MPFCPHCGWEYQSGVETCSDCGVALVDRPPHRQAGARREEREVKVAEVANETLANMWAGLLESNGIPCVIKASGVSIGGWGYATLLPHYLYVLASHEQRAIDLLRSYADDDPSLTIKPTR